MKNPIHVLIVEDEDLIRSGLEIIIQNEEDMKVAGTAANGREALDIVSMARPDVVLLDLEMPVMNGIDCIVEIRKLHADLPILILSSYTDDEYICQALACGANGYLLKENCFDSMTQTIRDVMDNRFVLAAEVGKRIAQFVLQHNQQLKTRGIHRYFEKNNIYTQQEQDIILLLLARMPNKEIAKQLFFSEGTIKNKLTVIYEKIGVTSRQEAIDYFEEKVLL